MVSSLFAKKPAPAQHYFYSKRPEHSLPILLSPPALFQCIVIIGLYLALPLDYEIPEVAVILTSPESNTVLGKQWPFNKCHQISY